MNPEKIKNTFLSTCGHKTDTFFPNPEGPDTLKGEKGFLISFPTYKKTPRVEYQRVPVDEFSYRLEMIQVKDLSLPLTGRKLIVSRDVLRAIPILARKLFVTYPWLKEIDGLKRIRRVSFERLDTKIPELSAKLREIGTREEQRKVYGEFKRYLFRDDIYAPGQQIRNDKNEVVAAYQLIKEVEDAVL
jgi:hypothetical protein